MLKRRLPGTELELSVVGMGCWAIGGLWWGDDVTAERSQRAIEQALELGINWFDTAPLYGHGHADEILVETLGERRHDVIIATKVGVRWDGDGAHARSDLTAEYVIADTELSLKRLGRSHIDLLQVHWPCENETPLDETLGALMLLQKQGKIRYFGLCNYAAGELTAARRIAPIASLQTPYSMLRREFERDLQAICCGEQPLAALIYEPLCRGLLTGKFGATHRFADSDLRARDDRFTGSGYLRALTIVSRLALIAKQIQAPVATIALAWVLRQPGVTAAIAGAKGPEQVREHARALDLIDNAQIWPQVQRIVDSFRG